MAKLTISLSPLEYRLFLLDKDDFELPIIGDLAGLISKAMSYCSGKDCCPRIEHPESEAIVYLQKDYSLCDIRDIMTRSIKADVAAQAMADLLEYIR